MSNVTCPRCGAQASGNFCSSCGSPLQLRSCPSCGATPEAGARFCNLCGHALAGATPATASTGKRPAAAAKPAGAPAGDSRLGWWVAGFALVALIVIVAVPIVRPEGAQEAPAPTAGAGAAGVDLSTMTPREAADRLYNRVMTAAENGDSAQVQMFLPMAIQAYDQARPLDPDGHYHLSLLLRTGGDPAGALAVAQEALEGEPDHLLNLAAAAEAAESQGDVGTSRAYYGRFLDVYDQEIARERPEYAPAPNGHGNQLVTLRQQALAATGR